MDHSGHSGMDMSSNNSFTPTNKGIAMGYWYGIAVVIGTFLLVQIVHMLQARHRIQKCRTESVRFPTRPTNIISQLWATMTAVVRESSYPQLNIPFRGFGWMSPPPLGRAIVLLVYWAVIVGMMVDKAIINDAYFWERIGYRNAWVTVMQLPLLFMLASKTNIIALLIGSSHERLNWFHRWVARTIFVTASVHGFHFWTQWVRADFVEFQMEMMPMTKYGLGAWGVMLWMNLSGLAPIRRLAYEVFVAQHIVSAAVLLWLVYVHVPEDTRYFVWWVVGAVCFDRVFRLCLLAWQNIRLKTIQSTCKGMRKVGHQAQLTSAGESITVVTIKDAHFSWRAGQHLYLWIPKIGPLEAHPYTIACAHQVGHGCCCNSIQLVIRAHKGFSKRIHDYATKAGNDGGRVTAFIYGPYGAPPRFDTFETLVLISASTGASFTLPILESVLQAKDKICTTRVDFIIAARNDADIQFYVQRLYDAVERAKNTGLELRVHVCVTGRARTPIQIEKTAQGCCDTSKSEASSSTSGRDSLQISKAHDEEGATSMVDIEKTSARKRSPGVPCREEPALKHLDCRPDLDALIRNPVEAAGGETSVIVCGGPSLVSRVRNSVSRLSDERAVHKGTGAQGVHLHVEEYSF